MKFEEYELKKLETVRNLILKQLTDLATTLQDRRKDLIEANKAVWAETPIIRNMDDAMNLITISSEIAQHERQYAQADFQIGQLKNMLGCPYFARIDFKEDGYDDIETIYIGRNSLSEDINFHVYDWRAPISSLYYDYAVGKASFTVPIENTITGEITLKRQYRIESGELVFMFDSELTIDDQILQYELARTSEARIKSIIHTIQQEQNKAIRSPSERLLVFGPAGSGKTSVGLHRLAFLLYKHRGSLTSAKVRIFSPSPVFASYIEGIIPELGEEDVQTLDFPALLKSYSFHSDKNANYNSYEQMDFLQTASKNDPRRNWLAQKFCPKFTNFIEEYIKGYSPTIDEDILFNRDMICPKERIVELYRDRTSAGTLSSKTSRVLEYVSRAHEEYFNENKKAVSDFFNRLRDENLSDGAIRHRFDEQKNLVLADLRNRLLPKPKKLYERALRKWAKLNNLQGVNNTLRCLKWEKLLYEDALVLFFIKLLSGRIAKDNQVKHILIDEAQDISYLQHRILHQLYNCQFTVLADVNQALYPEIHLHDEEDLQSLYPSAETTRLNTSYRSTYEISKFAANILGKPDTNLYHRHGDEPQIIKTKQPVTICNQLLTELTKEFKTVGILLPDIKSAKEFHQQLKSHHTTLISDWDDSFEQGIMVMSVPFAKGLEFDAVICPNYDTMDSKLLYLVCTRALHKLYLLSS